MGIGEALVTMLNEKGIPTPLVHTMLPATQPYGCFNRCRNTKFGKRLQDCWANTTIPLIVKVHTKL